MEQPQICSRHRETAKVSMTQTAIAFCRAFVLILAHFLLRSCDEIDRAEMTVSCFPSSLHSSSSPFLSLKSHRKGVALVTAKSS